MDSLTLLKTRFYHIANQIRSRNKLEQYRLRKFRKLVTYIHQRSHYYRDLIQTKNIDLARCTPSDFPVLTKEELIEHFDSIVTDRSLSKRVIEDFLASSRDPRERLFGKYYIIHTSGSSGTVCYIPYSNHDLARGMALGLRIQPFKAEIRRIAFFGASDGHFAGVTMASAVTNGLAHVLYKVQTFDIAQPLEHIISGLNSFRPTVLIGYPSALKILAEKQIAGALSISPTAIQTGGELLGGPDRQFIEHAFAAQITNVYACSEHLYLGAQFPDSSDMCLFEDNLFFEIEPDYTLVTNCFNYTLPLIRYQMKDRLIQHKKEMKYSWPFTRIKEIEGRAEQVVWLRNDKGDLDFISPHIINEIFVKRVHRFQMLVKSDTRIHFKIVQSNEQLTSEQIQSDFTKVVKKILRAKHFTPVHFSLEFVDTIPNDPKTGKFNLILESPN